MDKLVVTRYNNCILQAFYENNRLMELILDENDSVLESIYIGKVSSIVNNINACFVDYGGDKPCYYSITDNKHIFLNKKKNSTIKVGDELLIQITRDAVKTKNPVASSELFLRGEYCIINLTGQIGISSKITSSSRRNELKKLAASILPDNMGCIIRTICQDSDNDTIAKEIKYLSDKLSTIIEKAKTRTCFSCLYKRRPAYLDILLLKSRTQIGDIITDDETIYNDFSEFIKNADSSNNINLILYDDKLRSLISAYDLNSELTNIYKEKVWLKSGAYLVIQQTEAMVVVDVNTGKAIKNKAMEDHLLNVNTEAAIETCRQLRLRNLSGIIMIDFINMKNPANIDLIRDILIKELAKDFVPAKFVDITKLGIVELTRKKIRRPNHEILSKY